VAVPDALSSGLVEVSGDQAERLSTQAAALGPGELTRAAEVIAEGLTEMRGTTAPRLHLELMCARILLPGADVDARGIHARLDRLERRIGMNAGLSDASALGNTAPPPHVDRQPAAAEELEASQPPDRTREDDWPEPVRLGTPEAARPDRSVGISNGRSGGEHEASRDAPAESPTSASQDRAEPEHRQYAEPSDVAGHSRSAERVEGADARPAALRPSAAAGERVSAGRQSLSITDVRRLWPEVLEEVKGRRRFTWILLSQNAHVADVSDGVLLLAMPNSGARDSFAKGGSEDILREALITVLGVDLRVTAMVDPSTAGPARSGAGSRPSSRSPAPVSEPASVRSGRESPPRPGAPAGRGGQDAPGAPDAPSSRGGWAGVDPPPDPLEESQGSDGSDDGAYQAVREPSGEPEPEPDRPRRVDEAVLEQARQSIRATRRGPRGAQPDDDRDAAADRDDETLDESDESHTELLARQLGAEIIAEEEHGT
jgi:DNA polymerase-3 subunit gamma/tau